MANPHPTKQRKPASDAMSARLKKKFPAYTARQRQPGEAEPYTRNTFASKGNRYRTGDGDSFVCRSL